MAQIKRLRRKEFVRFFTDYIICDHCGGETRGRCYAETEKVVCSICNEILLDARQMEEEDDEDMMVIMFTTEGDNDDS